MSKHLTMLVVVLLFPFLVRAADIHEAVRKGDITEVNRLLKARPGLVDVVEKNGVFTPLQLAALRGDRPVLQALLTVKVDPKNLTEALRYSCWRGEVENAQLLLDHGALVPPSLLDAVMNNLEVDDQILIDPKLQTKLIKPTAVIIEERKQLARMALKGGAVVDYHAPLSAETPLFYSFYWGAGMVKLLLEAGADVRVHDIEQRASVVHFAALTASDPEVFKLLADKNLSVNLRDRLDRTPLAWAARKGNVVAVKALLGLGADVKAVDGAGWTALHSAAAAGKVEVMQLLLDAGADFNARNSLGWTPLFTAARFDQPEAVKLLVTKGAELNVPDIEGHPALAAAAGNWAEAALRDAGAKEVARICEGKVCDFERELRTRRKLFFDQTPKKDCILLDAETGLFTVDIMEDDFGIVVGDVETGTFSGMYKLGLVDDGRLTVYRNVRPAYPMLIPLDSKVADEARLHFRLEVRAGNPLEPGHLNRLIFGAGGLYDIIISAYQRETGLSGILRSFQID